MAWEWLAPTGTVVGSMITAGVGAYFGSKKTQERQHRFERESSVLVRGREKADQAIEALRILQGNNDVVAALDGPDDLQGLSPEQQALEEALRHQFERLGHSIEYLTEPAIRSEIALIYDTIYHLSVVDALGEGDVTTARALVWCACREGIALLGRYIRGEPVREPSDYMKMLRVRVDTALAELDRQLAAGGQ